MKRAQDKPTVSDGDSAMRTVLVTGAAGTVGIYVVNELLTRGYRVRAVDLPGRTIDISALRISSEQSPMASGKLDLHYADLTVRENAIHAMRDVSFVIHLAAIIDISLSYEKLKRVNVDMVKYLFDAACVHKVKRFVFFSSASIFRGKDGVVPNTENDELCPESPYEQSKLDSEEYILNHTSSTKPEVIIVRPGMIYGPRAQFLGIKIAMIPILMYAFMGSAVKINGLGGTNFIHAEDVARASVFLMEKEYTIPDGGKLNEIYIVVEPEPISGGAFVEVAAKALCIPVKYEITVPMWFRLPLQVFARLSWLIAVGSWMMYYMWAWMRWWHSLEDRLNTTLDEAAIKYSAREMRFSCEKLQKAGFVFKHDVRKSYRDVMKWYQEKKWIPSYPQLSGERTFEFTDGLKFHETMHGDCTFLYGEKKKVPFDFECDVIIPSTKQFEVHRMAMLEGRATLAGVAQDAQIQEGSLCFFVHPAGLKYDFKFRDPQNKLYRFTGEKRYSLRDPVTTMTTARGELIQDGVNIADTTVVFNMGDIWKLLKSVEFTACGAGPITRPRAFAHYYLPTRWDSNFWYLWTATTDGKGFLLDLIERPTGLQLRLALFDITAREQRREVVFFPSSQIKYNNGKITVGSLELTDTYCKGTVNGVEVAVNFDISEGRRMTFVPGWMQKLLKLFPHVNSRYGVVDSNGSRVANVQYPPGTHITYSDYIVPYHGMKHFRWSLIAASDFKHTDLHIEVSGMPIIENKDIWLAGAYIRYCGNEYHINDPLIRYIGAVGFTSGGILNSDGTEVEYDATVSLPEFNMHIHATAPRHYFVHLEHEGLTDIYSTVNGSVVVTITSKDQSAETKSFECKQRALLETKTCRFGKKVW